MARNFTSGYQNKHIISDKVTHNGKWREYGYIEHIPELYKSTIVLLNFCFRDAHTKSQF